LSLRILFVAMPDSIHAARWINQTADAGWDIHVFPATPEDPHPDLRGVTVYGFSRARRDGSGDSVRFRSVWPFETGSRPLARRASRFNAALLAWLIRRLKPDIVHSLEIQHAGYLTLDARARADRFPAWIVTNWGSDIYLFGRLPEHAERIRGVLSACDYYSCECRRDVALARQFGFSGTVLPVLPNAGGLQLDRVRELQAAGPPSARRLIVVKGYQSWAGRALVALEAIRLCAEDLRGYEVAVYLATPEVELAATLVAQDTGLALTVVPRCSHEDILRLHGRARASIGLSISDALSTSALEALASGSFPIQSRTACIDEWVRGGETALLVDPDDPHAVAGALRRVLSDDRLVDRAAEENRRLASERLDEALIRPQVLRMYENVAAASRERAVQGAA
jgi:glycosyltransferase involved in cell wall biosynthesis